MSIRDTALADMERRRAEAALDADRLTKELIAAEARLMEQEQTIAKQREELVDARQEIADLRGLTLWRLLKMWWKNR